MRTVIRWVLAAAVLAGAADARSATIINIDARVLSGTRVTLAAGRYRFAFIGIADGGAFDAYSKWNHAYPFTDPRSLSDCRAGLAQCRYGYSNAFRLVAGSTTTVFQLAADLTPPRPNYTQFATTAAALAAARDGPYTRPLEFALVVPTRVAFKTGDSSWWDNEGGLSLIVTRIPEPAAWATMTVGFAAVGLARRRRRTSVTA